MSITRCKSLDVSAVRDALREYALRLGQRQEVVTVLLFGSLAEGTYTGSSDADVMVIVERSDTPFLARGLEYAEMGLPIPLDLFVYTVGEVRSELASGSSLVKRALDTGETLFQRNAVRF